MLKLEHSNCLIKNCQKMFIIMTLYYAKTIDSYEMFLITNRSNISACKCYEKAGGINDADDEVVYVYDFREEN